MLHICIYTYIPGVGNINPLQYSGLGTSMDRGARRATVHRVTKSQTRLSTCSHTHTHTHTRARAHTGAENAAFFICDNDLF